MREVLGHSKLFSGASPADLQALGCAACRREFPVGAQIFAEGDHGDGIYIIQAGTALITALVGHDQRRTLARLGPGDFFGEMAVLDNEPRSATALAETEAVAAFIPRAALLAVLENSPRLAVNLVREFSLRLRDFNRRYLREVIEAERLALMGRFARSIVHDFKNPLNVISLAAEIATRDNAPPAARRTAGQSIAKQVSRLSGMINELLDFSRGSQSAVVLATANYAQFVNQLLDELRPELAEREVRLVCPQPPPEFELLLDPARLTRVFINLINNAVEAISGGGEITMRFSTREDEVWTEIEDSGRGIAPEIAGQIFEPFATFGKAQGTGLGLSICRRIIEDHRGRIFVRSEPGRGAIFVFTLPRSK